MGKKPKIVFDETARRQFLKEKQKGKYTKKEKEVYKKKLKLTEDKKNKVDNHKLYKDEIDRKFKEINEKMREMNHYYSDDDGSESENDKEKMSE